ncbi:uncharacterized protein THITE_2123301 [Thermothielavioides terrestris NRRL 8126]|uniref:Uncharacterized protein n=1 Tax=Thermothielavioides terrestris (strain ATCC 38088 / NRRL 8126) TaxID=578455 RepID=G2RH62_THETT|nr:uncharacterized protein THITE_2123301 [Thermothielavioides terrestris NRRL 8126]AEO71174.1 hypothetical protein THITE_2123301 [Thermothielavioides terrestris NRRL 8126]
MQARRALCYLPTGCCFRGGSRQRDPVEHLPPSMQKRTAGRTKSGKSENLHRPER